MKIDLSRFRQTFFQEATDHVNNMEAALLALNPESIDAELLNSIFRAAHSIKGGSGTFAFDNISRFTHVLEELLDGMRQGKIPATSARIQLLLNSCDVLRGLLTAAEAETPIHPGTDNMMQQLITAQREDMSTVGSPSQTRKDDVVSDSSALRKYDIEFAPSPNIFREGMDPLLILRDVEELGKVLAVQARTNAIPPLESLSADTCFLAWKIQLETEKPKSDIEDVFAFVEDGAQIVIRELCVVEETHAQSRSGTESSSTREKAAPRKGPLRESTSIRVATEKVDQLINLVGELVIAQSMAVDIIENFSLERLHELRTAFSEVCRNTRDLQDRVMGVRMLPVGTVFGRLPRIVHDIASSRGKSIQIEIVGEETELDRLVLEGMVDPLTHLVRNAADHGIEAPEERRLAGKSETGIIGLHARHEAGSFVIEITDDGRGLNTEKIRAKAIERGLLTASEEMTTEQIQRLIFAAGFSTAETISEVSGRGVGMDVVRKNVESLGGIVAIKSVEGKGTTVTMKVPLTLAILDGQLVQIGTQQFVLPLVSIVESIRPKCDQVQSVAGQGEVVTVRGESLPLIRLYELFSIPTRITEPCHGLVAIVEHESRRFALLVDELLNQQQVVIKNLQSNFRKVEGAMGATILGNGCVALILDVPGLVELSRKKVNSAVTSPQTKSISYEHLAPSPISNARVMSI